MELLRRFSRQQLLRFFLRQSSLTNLGEASILSA